MIRILWRGLTLACAVCGTRGLFRRWVSQRERCPRCGLRFERAEGHWLGAIAVNTVLSAFVILVAVVARLVTLWPDVSAGDLFVLIVPIGLIAPVLIFPLSRTLWGALDVLMSPPGDDEVAAEFAAPRSAS